MPRNQKAQEEFSTQYADVVETAKSLGEDISVENALVMTGFLLVIEKLNKVIDLMEK